VKSFVSLVTCISAGEGAAGRSRKWWKKCGKGKTNAKCDRNATESP